MELLRPPQQQKKKFTIRQVDGSKNKFEKLDELLRLFKSDKCTADILLTFLYKKFDQNGMRHYIINKLYSFSFLQINNIIPQISYIAIRRESKFIEQLIADRCAEDINFYLKFLWCLQSFGHIANQKKEKKDKVDRLISVRPNNLQASLWLNKAPPPYRVLRSEEFPSSAWKS